MVLFTDHTLYNSPLYSSVQSICLKKTIQSYILQGKVIGGVRFRRQILARISHTVAEYKDVSLLNLFNLLLREFFKLCNFFLISRNYIFNNFVKLVLLQSLIFNQTVGDSV